MRNSQLLIQTSSSTGDAAVDGLFGGAVAGVMMAIYLVVIGSVAGGSLAATLSIFDLGQGSSPVRGALVHLAISTIYGVVFGLGQRLIGHGHPVWRGYTVIIGLAYGLLLWVMTQIAFAGGLNVPLSNLPIVHFAAAHALYGLTLGWLSSRSIR